jgi:hypothetical protein
VVVAVVVAVGPEKHLVFNKLDVISSRFPPPCNQLVQCINVYRSLKVLSLSIEISNSLDLTGDSERLNAQN